MTGNGGLSVFHPHLWGLIIRVHAARVGSEGKEKAAEEDRQVTNPINCGQPDAVLQPQCRN